MAVTQILAALIGLYFICGGIAILRDRKVMAGMMESLIDQPVLGYLGGVMAFAIGGTILAVHSLWTGWLAGFVTLVGWVALAEGVLLIAAREPFLRIVSKLKLDNRFGTILSLGIIALGGVLLAASLL
ncbi:hypothetical protein [Anderseniella sp. Alg231-50]|uniref:hypothetical protein n=1 Tax=Anderseniella sp. Alg231-50 TaxID=1922226 RepID=UPI00307CA69D